MNVFLCRLRDRPTFREKHCIWHFKEVLNKRFGNILDFALLSSNLIMCCSKMKIDEMCTDTLCALPRYTLLGAMQESNINTNVTGKEKHASDGKILTTKMSFVSEKTPLCACVCVCVCECVSPIQKTTVLNMNPFPDYVNYGKRF